MESDPGKVPPVPPVPPRADKVATVVLTEEQRRILTRALGFPKESVPSELKLKGFSREEARQLGIITRPGPNAWIYVVIS